MYEVFEQLLQKFGVSSYQVAKDTGISQSTLSSWKARRNLLSGEKATKIANYFGVSVDYLMTGKEPNSNAQLDSEGLNSRDRNDIAKDMENIREKLMNKEDGPASYNGENIDDDDAELLLDAIEMMLKRVKKINKVKYNPNKNKN